MTRLLIIHDLEGYIVSKSSGYPTHEDPVGIPFAWVDVPEGKRVKEVGEIGVDVSITPHQVILEDIPKSEVELLREKVQAQEEALVELADLLVEVLG